MLFVWAFLVVSALLVIHAVAALYIADSFTRPKRRRVQGTPADLGLRYEEVQFLTADRVILHGWFLDSPGARATVVLVHDIEGTRADPEYGLLELQRDYVRRGYHVFAFDLRGRGESGGSRDYLGAGEQLDVQAAVAYVRRRLGSLPIVVHGFGMGATLSVAAVGRGLDVTGVIADSPFRSMRSYLRQQNAHVPQYLFSLATWVSRRVYHVNVDALSAIGVMDRTTVPIFFIHAAGDPEVPVEDTLNLCAACLDPRSDVWVVPHVEDHCGAYLAARDGYLRRCLQFIDRAVPARVLRATAV